MKAFKYSPSNPYIQDIILEPGTYTFGAKAVFAYGYDLTVGVKTASGSWIAIPYEIKVAGGWNKDISKTFTITERCVQFNIMYSGTLYNCNILSPWLKKGSTSTPPSPNTEDLLESLQEGSYTVLLSNENHTFAGTETTALAGSTETQILIYKGTERVFPTSITVDTADLPTGMSRTISLETSRVTFNVTTSMTSANGTIPITFVVNGRSMTILFSYSISFKGADGTAPGLIRLTTPFQLISIDSSGTMIPSSPFVVIGTPTNTTITTWRYSTDGAPSSTTTPPTGVTRSGNTVTIDPLTVTFKTLNISASNGSISDSITIVKVADAVPPIIVNGFWAFWDYALQDYVTSEFSATGDDGHSPYILNEYWWEWDSELGEYVNTGIKAVGKDGADAVPPIIVNGFWAFWDYALQDYVTSEFSATGDDGHSPYILNEYWWEWDSELGEYVNTGIKAVGKDGADAVPPIIVNGFWAFWDYALQDYVTSEFSATGDDGHSPYILNEYWWEWDSELGEYVNTGIKAVGKDGADAVPPIIVNGFWAFWDYALQDYVTSEFSATGDDGHSPYILNEYWWEWDSELGEYVNTGIKAVGKDGKDGASTEWGYLLNDSSTPPTKPTGTLPNGGWSYTMGSISASNKYLWITSRAKPEGASSYGVWADATLHARWARDGVDGVGMPGQVPFTKEWVAGDRHRNSSEIIDYIYVRGTSSATSYWYQLIASTDIEGIVAGAPPSGGVVPTGYKSVSWMNALALKTLIAEEANLANFIFKEGSLLSIAGTTFAGEEIVYGEYTEYNFANTTTQPAVDSASWTPLPSGTLRWARYKKNTASSWTVKQIGTSAGQWTMQFSTAPEGATWHSSYSTNRFWAKVKEGSGDYGFPFKITTSGGYDFIPNAMIDGVNGIIKGEKVIASNIRNKIYNASSFSPSQIEGLLAEGKSVSFSVDGMFDSDYNWYTINLPNNRDLAGSILTLHMPKGSVKRYRIKPGHVDGMFYTSEPLRTLNQIQVVPNVRGTIELKAVWDDLIGSLDWHILSQSRYMVNTGSYATESRIPPYFLPNELIFNGTCIVTDSTLPTISKDRQLTNALIQVDKVTSGVTKKIEIIVPMQSLHDSLGGTMYRPYNSRRFLRLEADTSSSLNRVVVTSSYEYNNYWAFEVTIFNSSNVQIYTSFNFRIFTNDYFIQSPWMGHNLNEV